jgi:hypothetical protein
MELADKASSSLISRLGLEQESKPSLAPHANFNPLLPASKAKNSSHGLSVPFSEAACVPGSTLWTAYMGGETRNELIVMEHGDARAGGLDTGVSPGPDSLLGC